MLQRLRSLAPSREQLEANPWLRRLAPQLSDPKLWHWSRRGVAAGMSIGLFIGLLIPVAQIFLAAAVAIVLRANVPIAAGATLITNPLTVAPIYYAAYRLGAWVTGSTSPVMTSFNDPAALWDKLGAIGLPLFTGLGIAAIVSAAAGYVLISQAWAWHVAGKRRRSRS
ncbi:MAG: DUF2062 domain-containing protein [Zoogloeaceae bacterium]|nr:DUF2062 domain-containing protein [Zoogloeaceae bacterium]